MMYIYVGICVGNVLTIVLTYEKRKRLIATQKKLRFVIILIFFKYLCAMK